MKRAVKVLLSILMAFSLVAPATVLAEEPDVVIENLVAEQPECFTVGTTRQLEYKVSPSNYTEVQKWEVIEGDTDIIDVTNSGVVTASKLGHVIVQLTIGDKSAKFYVNVVGDNVATSVYLEPKVTMTVGGTIQYNAVPCLPPDATNMMDAVWFSVDPTIVSINNRGTVTAHKEGVTTLKLKLGKLSAECVFTVVAPVGKATSVKITGGSTVQMNQVIKLDAELLPVDATNKNEVRFYSSDEAVARVDILHGTVFALTEGVTTITVNVEGVTDTILLTVLPELQEVLVDELASKGNLTLQIGEEGNTYPIVKPDNATNKAEMSFRSSDTAIVAVGIDGVVKAISEGTATITAYMVSNARINCECIITVKGNKSTEPTPVPTPTASVATPTDITVASKTQANITVTVPKELTDLTDIMLETMELTADNKDAIAVRKLMEEYKLAKVYDISLFSKGLKLTAVNGGMVNVRLPYNGDDSKFYDVVRLNDDNTVTKLLATYENGFITFNTNHFSVYAVAERVAKAPTVKAPTVITPNPKTGDSNFVSLLFISILMLLGASLLVSRKFIGKNQ